MVHNDYSNQVFVTKDDDSSGYSEKNYRFSKFLWADLSRESFVRSNFDYTIMNWSSAELADFSHCSFVNAELKFVNWYDCSLRKANFFLANLSLSAFRGVMARKTIFTSSEIINSNFDRSDFEYADFSNCSLFGTTFRGSNVGFANFTGAIGVDLTGAYGQQLAVGV